MYFNLYLKKLDKYIQGSAFSKPITIVNAVQINNKFQFNQAELKRSTGLVIIEHFLIPNSIIYKII